MQLKNFSRNVIRVTAPIGGHVIRVKSGEVRTVPEHLEEAAIRAGLVPLEDVMSQAEREAELAAEAERQAKAEREAELAAEAEKAAILEEEAEKAKRSAAAKKAAATRAANKEQA